MFVKFHNENGKMLTSQGRHTKVLLHFLFHWLALANFIYFQKNMGDAQKHMCYMIILGTFWAHFGHVMDTRNQTGSMGHPTDQQLDTLLLLL